MCHRRERCNRAPTAALGLALLLVGCAAPSDALILGTTTTLQDSGLLEVLIPAFASDVGVRAQAVVGGTGETLEKAKRGDVDVILTHSPAREAMLVAEGTARERRSVMWNVFAIVGPADDPAGVASARSASDAVARIRANESLFVSRGDESGTHERELALWRAAGLDPATFPRAEYKETGSGQGTTLLFASEHDAYTLVDRGTLLRFHAEGKATRLADLFHDDEELRNEYAVSLLVASSRPDEARAFADWLVDARGRAAISSLRVAGEPLFTPVGGAP